MRVVGIVLCCALAGACSRSEPTPPAPAATPTGRTKQPEVARKLIASGAVVLDVRTADEYAEEHVPTAVNIPVDELPAHLDEVAKLVGNDKAQPIVVYCAAGSRAAKAKAKLEAAGYTHVTNGGGLDDLR